LEPTSLETTDIFRGAYLLASGGDLAEIRVRQNGKRIATFLITGKDLARLDRDYRSGRALINPVPAWILNQALFISRARAARIAWFP